MNAKSGYWQLNITWPTPCSYCIVAVNELAKRWEVSPGDFENDVIWRDHDLQVCSEDQGRLASFMSWASEHTQPAALEIRYIHHD